MSATARVYSSSAGIDAARLTSGRDLVLEIDDADGEQLAFGVGARDHLDVDARRHAVGSPAWRWRAGASAATRR